MSINIYSKTDIDGIRDANQIVAKTLKLLENEAKVGVSLLDLDDMAEKFIISQGAKPSFKGLYGFPNSVCCSLNEVIIHGIPTNYKLKEGDIIGFDVGTIYKGFYGDAAVTLPIGNVSKQDLDLIACAKDTLYYAIDNIKVDMRFKELSALIGKYIKKRGYVPLLNYCGHGIGKGPHEKPQIPNYHLFGRTKSGEKIKNGMVFCIEPMICQESGLSKNTKGWNTVSIDGKRGSHYEHCLAIYDDQVEILSQDTIYA